MKRTGTSVAGFTLVELLAVIVIVAVLAGLLLPGLARARDRATATACQNHLRQLQVAFQLYAEDHRGELTPSETEISRPNGTRWVNGIMSPFSANSLSELTNRQMLIEPGPGHLGPYVGVPEVFHCPGDRSRTNLTRARGPLRVRSYTMNRYMVSGDGIAIEADGTFTYSRTSFVKFADFSRTSPSAIWVFIDEHELTITNGRFDLQWPMGLRWKWAGNWPARRHGGRGVLSFADGHGELRRWKDPRTGPPVRTWAEAWAIGFEAQNNADYAWLWERTNGPWPFPAH